MTQSLPHGLTDCLLWSEELGMGYHPRQPMDYEGPYFKKYQQLDNSKSGAALTKLRVDLVSRHYGDNGSQVIDIGVGGGRFVTQYGCWGFDVNAEAVAWLEERASFRDPYQHEADALTFWDSLEHIPDPESAVACARQWVFVSMPIYEGAKNCLESPHYKPGEHIWYWTLNGLCQWFERQGFDLHEVNHMETDAGRRGIMSFAFKRIGKSDG